MVGDDRSQREGAGLGLSIARKSPPHRAPMETLSPPTRAIFPTGRIWRRASCSIWPCDFGRRRMASGVYLHQIEAQEIAVTRKMVLLLR